MLIKNNNFLFVKNSNLIFGVIKDNTGDKCKCSKTINQAKVHADQQRISIVKTAIVAKVGKV
jgi:hypothetical protein